MGIRFKALLELGIDLFETLFLFLSQIIIDDMHTGFIDHPYLLVQYATTMLVVLIPLLCDMLYSNTVLDYNPLTIVI